MILRPARAVDFLHLETFVWQAIFPAFDLPGLSERQRSENDALVEGAKAQVDAALVDPNMAVFVALDAKRKMLMGYLIADATPRAYAQIPAIVVTRAYWGKGVASKLMEEATNFIGCDRAISLAVRYYNQRALAFFAKHDFENTGETTGDHAIPRTLLLREAYEILTPPSHVMMEPEKDEKWDDFPTGADEPKPVYEALPDYRLTTDDVPLFETGANALATEILDDSLLVETTLKEEQLSELEAFIARARAKKGVPPPTAPALADLPAYKATARKPVNTKPAEHLIATPKTASSGEGSETTPQRTAHEETPAIKSEPTTAGSKPSFEFAFDAVPPIERTRPSEKADNKRTSSAEIGQSATLPKPEKITKSCLSCATELPVAARFCFGCGFPQPPKTTAAGDTNEQQIEDDFLTLEALPEEATKESPALAAKKTTFSSTSENATKTTAAAVTGEAAKQIRRDAKTAAKQYRLSELKRAFRDQLTDRTTAYFGAKKVPAFTARLASATGFQQLRDGILANLATWLNEPGRSPAQQRRRLQDTLADLTEYFIVETAGSLSHQVFPQRLLRHQSVNWETVDLFQLVMDYLDFDHEREVIYTDFVSMPTRALRNATKSFLRARKDERIFFICDQSLVSQAKNGFAITDSGIYWKNVLQPAGVAMFNEIKQLNIQEGYLDIDGQFFNGGGTLNLKIALLLDKLRRM